MFYGSGNLCICALCCRYLFREEFDAKNHLNIKEGKKNSRKALEVKPFEHLMEIEIEYELFTHRFIQFVYL
jgi:hypothetical protein